MRVDELLSATVDNLGVDRGHRVLAILGEDNRRAKVPLAPVTWAALETYLTDRARRGGLGDWRQLRGPLLATATGARMQRSQVWELVQRLARAAGLEMWAELAIHSLRHTAITLALDAGASLRDVQDSARHKDARTTRRYDRSRGNLDRSPKIDADRFLTTVESSKLAGTYVDPTRSRITVGVIAEQWICGKINLKATTRARYASALAVHVLPRWKGTYLAEITPEDVQKWIIELGHPGQSGASVRKSYGVLRGVLALAVRDHRIATNPADGVNLPSWNQRGADASQPSRSRSRPAQLRCRARYPLASSTTRTDSSCRF